MSAIYGKAKEKFLTGGLNWLTADVRVVLVDSADYTVDISTHEFLSSVPSAARIATSTSLTGKTAALGVADAADVSIAGVTGDPGEALVIYAVGADDASSPLIAYIDGLSFVPNGAAVEITWDNGPNKIFQI